MLINWFTVLAQIVNFLILLLLLKRFLYKPIIKAMQSREKKIAARMEDAETGRQEALQQKKAMEKERQDLEARKENMMTEARREVEQWQETQKKKARREIEQSRQSWHDSLESDHDRFYKEFKTRVTEQVINISRKVLTDLADENMENQIARNFIRKLTTDISEVDEKTRLAQREFRVRSSFALNNEVKTELEKTLKQRFSNIDHISYDITPDLGCGIRLLSGDWKIEWNLAWYLQTLETTILPQIKSGEPA